MAVPSIPSLANITRKSIDTQRTMPNSNQPYDLSGVNNYLSTSNLNPSLVSASKPAINLDGTQAPYNPLQDFINPSNSQNFSFNGQPTNNIPNLGGTQIQGPTQTTPIITGPVDTFEYDTDKANADRLASQPQATPTEFTDEQWNSFNTLMNSKLSGAPLGSVGMEGGYSGQPTSLQLRQEMLRDRAQGTGLYSIPKGTYATPEQIMGVRAMADKHYSDLIGQYSDVEKNDASRASKTPAYGLDSIMSGLSSPTANKIYSMSSAFDSAPIVKDFNIIQKSAIDANNLMRESDANAKKGIKPTAGEDLQLIYMFAKAQDPNSVVREGEYNTVASYMSTLPQDIQSQISKVWGKEPTAKLTQQARATILNGINRKYTADKQQYTNLRKETANQIDLLSGKPIGSQLLKNYEGAETPSSSSASSKTDSVGGWENILED